MLALLRQAWAMDCPDCEAASFADISAASLSRYVSSHPKVEQEKERLKQKPFLAARSTILNAVSSGDKETARWYMERKRKREFSTLAQVETSEQSVFKDLTDEQLALIASGKATPADFQK